MQRETKRAPISNYYTLFNKLAQFAMADATQFAKDVLVVFPDQGRAFILEVWHFAQVHGSCRIQFCAHLRMGYLLEKPSRLKVRVPCHLFEIIDRDGWYSCLLQGLRHLRSGLSASPVIYPAVNLVAVLLAAVKVGESLVFSPVFTSS